MQQTYFLILFSIFLIHFSISQESFASESNSIVPSASTIEKDQDKREISEEEKRKFELCAVALCGNADQVNTVWKLEHQFADTADFRSRRKYFNQNLKSDIEKLIEIHRQLKQFELAQVKELIQSKDFHMDQKVLPIVGLIRFLKDFSSILEAKFNKNGQIELDEATSLENMKSYPEKKKKWFLRLGKAYYSNPQVLDALQFLFWGQEGYFQKKYPHQSMQEALIEDAKYLQVLSASLKMKLGKHFSTFVPDADFESSFLAEVIKNQDLTQKESEQYAHIRAHRLVCTGLSTSPEFQNLLDLPESLSEFIEEVGVEAMLRTQEEILNSEERFSRRVKSLMNQCQGSFTFLGLSAVSPQQNVAAKRNARSTIQRVSSQFVSKFSKETQKSLRERLKTVKFYFPSTLEESSQHFEKAIRIRLKSDEQVLKRAQSLQGEDARLVGLSSIYQSTLEESKQPLKSIGDTCAKLGYDEKPYSDRVISFTGKTAVSWGSVKEPKIGSAAMAHELGHVLYDFFRNQTVNPESKKEFERIAQCLKKMHSSTPSGHDEQYLEEDFADLVSNVSAPKEGEIFSCHSIFQSNNQYQDYDLLDSDANEPHSTNLFRAMHTYRVRHGDLPSVCEQVLKSQDPVIEIQNCLDRADF